MEDLRDEYTTEQFEWNEKKATQQSLVNEMEIVLDDLFELLWEGLEAAKDAKRSNEEMEVIRKALRKVQFGCALNAKLDELIEKRRKR